MKGEGGRAGGEAEGEQQQQRFRLGHSGDRRRRVFGVRGLDRNHAVLRRAAELPVSDTLQCCIELLNKAHLEYFLKSGTHVIIVYLIGFVCF